MKKFYILTLIVLCQLRSYGQTDIAINGVNYTTTDGGISYSVSRFSCYVGALNLGNIQYNNTTLNITSIAESAFNSCTSLTSIIIPNSVITIGDYCFQACSGLASVTIPNSVTSIGRNVFDSCSGLTSVTIPNTVTSIGNYAFQSCTGLTSVALSNSVTSIGFAAFELCTGLTSVSIPNTVISIGGYSFEGCSRLTSISIGSSVTSIGNNAFASCVALTSVTCLNPIPVAINALVFMNVAIANIPLTVPLGSTSTYRATAIWQNFMSINTLANVTFDSKHNPNIYPNPNNGKFSINSNKELVNQIKIYSLEGKLIFAQNTNTVNPEISLESISKGIYLATITLENGLETKSKIIIK